MAAAKCVSIVDDAVRMSCETDNQTKVLRLSTHRDVHAHRDRPPPLDPKLSTHPPPLQDRFSAFVACISQGNKSYVHIGSGGAHGSTHDTRTVFSAVMRSWSGRRSELPARAGIVVLCAILVAADLNMIIVQERRVPRDVGRVWSRVRPRAPCAVCAVLHSRLFSAPNGRNWQHPFIGSDNTRYPLTLAFTACAWTKEAVLTFVSWTQVMTMV